MIYYTRTQWYGLGYLTRARGSLLPHCLPAMILSGSVAGLFSSRILDPLIGVDLDEYFADAYSMQLAGLVFGYLCVARLNVSYNRYWEGVSHVKSMHSKWADACSQALTFDRIDDPAEDVSGDAYCQHITRLFCQLSAMSMLRLHLEEADRAKSWAKLDVELSLAEGADAPACRRASRASISGAPAGGQVSRGGGAAGGWVQRVQSWVQGTPPDARRLSERRGSVLGRSPPDKQAAIDETVDELKLSKLLTSREARYLRASPCPVTATAHRIARAVSTRGRTRGWKAPAPIVSRIFNELSNGLLAYNNAAKMKEIPVPFAYVQFNALLLNLFNIFAPIASAAFTDNRFFSVVTAVIISAGFTALWLVANELEDPFGTDYNDLPIMEYHEQFCDSIRALLSWLDEDTWVVGSGAWVAPRDALKASANVEAPGRPGATIEAGGATSAWASVPTGEELLRAASGAPEERLSAGRLEPAARTLSDEAAAAEGSEWVAQEESRARDGSADAAGGESSVSRSVKFREARHDSLFNELLTEGVCIGEVSRGKPASRRPGAIRRGATEQHLKQHLSPNMARARSGPLQKRRGPARQQQQQQTAQPPQEQQTPQTQTQATSASTEDGGSSGSGSGSGSGHADSMAC